MIFLDDRTGSKELDQHLTRVDTQLTRLEYGDAAFVGNGPEGPCFIGVERKALRDFIQSMVRGRLAAHQIPGMMKTYETIYVVVEGIWRSSPSDGTLQILCGKSWRPLIFGKRVFTAAEVWNFANTLTIKAGIHVVYTQSPKTTAEWLQATYRWWTAKDYDEHRSHTSLPVPRSPLLVRPSLLRRVAALLPGIAWGRSRAVAMHFESVWDMVNATEEEWVEIDGIGKGIAKSVYQALREEKRNGS